MNAKAFRILNGTILFALAFNIIYFIHELVLVVAGAWLGNDPILFHNNMHFMNMQQPSQNLAFAAGPVAVFSVGLICGGVYLGLRRSTGTFKLFVFWLSYHGLWLFLTQVPEIAFAAHGDFARGIAFLQLSQPVRILGAIFGVISLVLVGLFATKPLLETASTDDELTTASNRRKLIFQNGVLPWLLGSILIIPFRVPPLDRAILPFIGGFSLIWTLLNAGRIKNLQMREHAINKKLAWAGVTALLGVFLAFRLVLAAGVPMYNLFYEPNGDKHTSRVYRFVNGLCFDGTAFAPKTFYAVEGILRFEYAGQVDTTIDLQHKFVTPPFAEAHNHHFSDTQDYRAQINLYLTQGLFYGKNPNNMSKWTAPIRPHLNTPASVDVVYANGGLTASGGHPIQIYDFMAQQGNFEGWTKENMRNQAYFVVDNEKDLAAQWPHIRAGKPDFIKTYLEYSEEYELRKDDPKYFGRKALNPRLLPKIVAMAHADHLRVTAHVNTARDFHNTIIAGVDEITHLPLAKINEEDAKPAAQQGTVVVTTTLSHRPAGHVDNLEEIHRFNLQLLHNAGVKLAIGTDNGDLTALNEVENLYRLQVFDNLTLLKMWVENTPQTIFPERKLGHLQDGYEASFLALDGNPLEDFSNISKISFRFKQGHVIQLSEMQRSISEVLRPTIMLVGIDEAIAKYHQLKSAQPEAYNFAESELNQLGYQLLNHDKTKEAVAIFKLNSEAYPQSANVYDSLADAYKASGDSVLVIQCYEKVLELLPSNTHYTAALKQTLERNAREGLKRFNKESAPVN